MRIAGLFLGLWLSILTGQTAEPPADRKYIPADAALVIHVNLERLRSTPVGKELEQVHADAAAEILGHWTGDSDHNKKVLEENPMPKVFALSDTDNLKTKMTHFQGFSGNGAFFDAAGPVTLMSITDGTSNTLAGLTMKKAIPWTAPDDPEYNTKADLQHLLLFRNQRTQVSLADGSVRTLKQTISGETLHALITRSGGEVVSADD